MNLSEELNDAVQAATSNPKVLAAVSGTTTALGAASIADLAAFTPNLATPAKWHSEGWTGAQIDYDDVRSSDTFEADIEQLFMRIFETVSPLLS